MQFYARLILLLMLSVSLNTRAESINRIQFNDQDVFLSGSNVAWVDFARDIGSGTTDLDRFDEMFLQLSKAGGNTMRLWLHTNGAHTPEWNGSEVVGPGIHTIDDLRHILDKASEHGIGLVLCLWSFDMLRLTNGSLITYRAFDLLTDATQTQTYINNALIPMVQSLAGHPAIIAWEIFNEPEGMSHEHGWDFNQHVAMGDVQRFINMTAGAIHRADPSAQVTNGSWSFIASSDAGPAKVSPQAATLDSNELKRMSQSISEKYNHAFTESETMQFYDALSSQESFNYYTDERLIEAGGDPDGTLDFYTVHYYEWAGTSLSPFHNDYEVWGLTKPLVIAEFYMGGSSDGSGDGDPDSIYGIPYQELYSTLYDRGYAGALAWQWYNYPHSAEGVINWPRILQSTQSMLDSFPEAVVLNQGLRIVQFEAEPLEVEQGFSTELSWLVYNATAVTLDGNPVKASGTRFVSPTENTTYQLQAIDTATQVMLSMELTVVVLAPSEVNRAQSKPAFASTIETCCNGDLTADLAFDGDLNTRWSSAWDPTEVDVDPDNEWIYLDLQSAYDIERIVLTWEAAYGLAYNIDVSHDGRVWETVYEERNGDGATDDLLLTVPVSARYVRMQGLTRASEYGFSLREFEIYGQRSALQPPEVSLTFPVEGATLGVGTDTSITTLTKDLDGQTEYVDFFVDSQYLGTATEPPFSLAWAEIPEGNYLLSAAVTDNDGITVNSATVPIHVIDPGTFARFEAENASSEEAINIHADPQASGSFFAGMAGSFIFNYIDVPVQGDYLLVFRYQLPAKSILSRHSMTMSVAVNGETFTDLRFNGESNLWYERGLKIPLRAGLNTLTIKKDDGEIDIDYLDLSVDALNTAIE